MCLVESCRITVFENMCIYVYNAQGYTKQTKLKKSAETPSPYTRRSKKGADTLALLEMDKKRC